MSEQIEEAISELITWSQCALIALNTKDVCRESALHKKLREVMINYRIATGGDVGKAANDEFKRRVLGQFPKRTKKRDHR